MPKVTPPVSAPTNNLPSNTAGEDRTCVGSLASDAQSISSGRPQMTLFQRSIPSEVLTAYTVLPPAKYSVPWDTVGDAVTIPPGVLNRSGSGPGGRPPQTSGIGTTVI